MGHSIEAVLKSFDAKAEEFKRYQSSYRRIQAIRQEMKDQLDAEERTVAYQSRKMSEGFERLGTALYRAERISSLNKQLNELGYKVIPNSESIDDLVNNVREWALDKRLDEAESSKQMLKVVEETGEVAAALARGQEDELRDGIGDVMVTLIILAEQNGMTIHECLNQAYSEIADRKGQMVNGVFVKDGD